MLHREVEERDRERELDRTLHNEKTSFRVNPEWPVWLNG